MIPQIQVRPLQSQQGLSLKSPAKGQLHWINAFGDEREFFALVVDVTNCMCTVVPGILDAMQAGPSDIVLPRGVMGDFIALSPGELVSLPIESLGMGFARLNKEPYNKIIDAIEKIELGESEVGFERGYKYLSENDPRIEIHHRMLDGFIVAQRKQLPCIKIDWPEYKAAAAPQYQERLLSYTIKSKDGVMRRLEMLVKENEKRVEAVIVRDDGEVSEEYDDSFLEDSAGKELGRFSHGRMSFITYNGMSVQFRSSLDGFMPVELNLYLCP